jgi:hypothetical protein
MLASQLVGWRLLVLVSKARSYKSNVGRRLAVRRLGCMDLSGQSHLREVSIDENNKLEQ